MDSSGDHAAEGQKRLRSAMRQRIELSEALETARQGGDVARLLEAVGRGIEEWAVRLKPEMGELFADTDDGRFERKLTCGNPLIRPLFLMEPFAGASDAFDVFEFAFGESKATAFKLRLEALEQKRRLFAAEVMEVARQWDYEQDIGKWAAIDEHRSWLRQEAFEVSRYIASIVSLLPAPGAAVPLSHPGVPALNSSGSAGARPLQATDTRGQATSPLNRLNAMEQAVLVALLEKRCDDPERRELPSQEKLARWSGYKCDTAFKSALSGLVKAGLLDNRRHHGKRGGYFLTMPGRLAADQFRAASGLS